MARVDKIKGRAKEAVGKLTGDKHLEMKGKVDRASGKVKEMTDVAADKVKEVIDRAEHRKR